MQQSVLVAVLLLQHGQLVLELAQLIPQEARVPGRISAVPVQTLPVTLLALKVGQFSPKLL
jgi:hypothetical protein